MPYLTIEVKLKSKDYDYIKVNSKTGVIIQMDTGKRIASKITAVQFGQLKQDTEWAGANECLKCCGNCLFYQYPSELDEGCRCENTLEWTKPWSKCDNWKSK